MEPIQPESEPTPQTSTRPGRAIGLLGLLLGASALGTPLLPGQLAFFVLGLLILAVGLLQNVTGFARRDAGAAGTWLSRGGASILTGLLLMAMPKLTFAALALLLGLSWILSGGSAILAAIGRRGMPDWIWTVVDGAVNLMLGLMIALQWPVEGIVSVGLFVGLRYLAAGWSILMGTPPDSSPDAALAAGLHPDSRLGLASHSYFANLREELTKEVEVRSRSDRTWRCIFLFTFFAIHASRMDVEWNLVGMLSPVGAVIGDVALAIVLAYAIVAPVSVAWRTLTRAR